VRLEFLSPQYHIAGRAIFFIAVHWAYHLCGLVVRVPGYRYKGSGSILGATRFSEK
jgi:hypothetical protein